MSADVMAPDAHTPEDEALLDSGIEEISFDVPDDDDDDRRTQRDLTAARPLTRSPMSNLAQRILTGLAGAFVVVWAVWFGGWVFAADDARHRAARAARALRAASTRPARGRSPASGWRSGRSPSLRPLVPAAEALLVLGVPRRARRGAVPAARDAPARTPRRRSSASPTRRVLCGSLVALRVVPRPWLDAADHGAFWLTTAALFCIWGADSFAYFAGRVAGKHPLFPRVSPKKTWEGAAGGVVGAVVFAVGFYWFTPLRGVLTSPTSPRIAVAAGIASPFGDLAESHFKRSVDVKDSASLLPGHGGLMDRIDAAVVAVPLLVVWFDLVRG